MEPADDARTGNLEAISCSSSSFCLASYSDAVYAYHAGQWSAVVKAPAAASSLSCMNPSFCVGAIPDVTLYDGSALTHNPNIPANSVSCASTTFCVAVAGTGAAYTYTGGSFGGSSGAGGTGGGGGSRGSSAPEPKVDRISVSAGKLRVSLSCPSGGSACPSASVQAYVDQRVKGGRVRPTVIAHASYRLRAGKTHTLSVALNGTGRALLARLHKLTVIVIVSTTDRALRTTRVKFTRTARRR